jgi:hypothetical protein
MNVHKLTENGNQDRQLMNSMEQVYSSGADSPQLFEKFPSFCGTQRVIIVLTKRGTKPCPEAIEFCP